MILSDLSQNKCIQLWLYNLRCGDFVNFIVSKKIDIILHREKVIYKPKEGLILHIL